MVETRGEESNMGSRLGLLQGMGSDGVVSIVLLRQSVVSNPTTPFEKSPNIYISHGLDRRRNLTFSDYLSPESLNPTQTSPESRRTGLCRHVKLKNSQKNLVLCY
ncbi:hypothetical protein LOK49_LG13G01249 [Camellia lanceoleosa]|uniref:Uncharacterized protein n=1 Tax=Camellia lanceoleosa TaxID=1840588 RepID=A0ACC0FM33_9ERIC|nr:hypothetical protein LOK49_LG13G01249 [Camellia lanceoleosa]